MASKNPTVEVQVQIMGRELSMIRVGHVATENPCNSWIILQWSDQIHQPHTIRGNRILGDESDVLAPCKFYPQIAGASMAEILLTNSV